MSDPQRGNTKHGPNLDDQLEQETRGMVQGHGAPHAEPFRETEPLPDDTDSAEVQEAFEREDPDADHPDGPAVVERPGGARTDQGGENAHS